VRLPLVRTLVVAAAVLAGSPLGAWQDPAGVDLKTLIGNLASLDYLTRTHAARLVRRADAAAAVPALVEAVRKHPDEFVRHRAFVLLTAFNDRGTPALAGELLRDRNDRLREASYKWLEDHPEPRLADALLGALQSEQAEFVRPALIGALAALDDNAQVQRALVAEATRGLDLFREAVIESLGRQRAAYAVSTIAEISKLDGPLRTSAMLALGRIGGPPALAALKELAITSGGDVQTLRAALCLAGDGCEESLKALTQVAGTGTPAAAMRAAMAALTAIGIGPVGAAAAKPAAGVNPADAASAAIVSLGSRGGAVRDQAAIAFSAIALRRPDSIVAWLDASPESVRTAAIDLLKEGFERLEEDYAEEQFYAAARAAYWKGAEGSATRTMAAALIQRLEF
jgi:HEAT repeat protein